MEHPLLSSVMGPAVTATLLLRDYDKYNLSERICYHFDLTEALAASVRTVVANEDNTTATADDRAIVPVPQSKEAACGVAALLECVPSTPWHRLTRKQKRSLKNSIMNFNIQAETAHKDRTVCSYQPSRLPLRLNPSTRVFFAYETTRIVFCLDASPTLTSTFGFGGGNGTDRNNSSACCPIDKLPEMVRTFFTALTIPEQVPSTTNKGVWRPCLAVTVLAVYPRGSGSAQNSLLVRDFRVTDTESAELLSSKIEKWAMGEVETEIARRLSGGDGMANFPSAACYDAWTMPMYSSSLRDLLDAGDAALSTLSSAARPCIVIATDGRSVACDSVIDVCSDKDRVDIPLIVLDLSSASSHLPVGEQQQGKGGDAFFQLINYDPCGAIFPLHLSDDTEALYAICKATGGCFFDQELLTEAAHTCAGNVGPKSPFLLDQYFAFQSHTFRPNAVQWYTLFTLSEISENPHPAWGNLPPLEYIRRKLDMTGTLPTAQHHVPVDFRPSFLTARLKHQSSNSSVDSRPIQVRSTFATYTMNPIRIKVLILMRAREGYRAKRYGQSTHDPDKVFIHFTLPLEMGTIIHYELSYKALGGNNHMVGSAHIKIQLSGEPSFIQAVKNDFLHQGHRVRPVTGTQQVSAKLCTVLRWIRKEDAQQSYLTPLKWSDQLSKPDTPFVKRLGMLKPVQRRHHFRGSEFDCVCVGKMPYAHDEDILFEEFRGVDHGEDELRSAVAEWSTQTIEKGRRYVKRIQASDCDVASYCVIELARSPVASRVFTVSVDTFGGTEATDRVALVSSLKWLLSALKDVEVLPKQMGQFLVGVRKHQAPPLVSRKQRLLESHHNHATWDLVKDPELLPLLMKRRTEIGDFLLLESSDDHALFAKLVEDKNTQDDLSDPGDLVQYQIAILSDRVVIDLHMESEGGQFFPFRSIEDDAVRMITSKFHKMGRTLKKRDQECGHALRCRTNLLRVFDDLSVETAADETQLFCVEKLLPYASSTSLRLRFFHPGSGAANSVLRSLTEVLLLSVSSGWKVAKLSINAETNIEDLGPGDWFLVEFDKHTITFVHLSWTEKSEVSQEDGRGLAYRKLTFLTIGISDLYSRRDDVVDDDSLNDHISEYLCVSELSDLVEEAHKRNYSSAAYAALISGSLPAFDYVHLDDFAEVMRPLGWVEVAKVLVAGASDAGEGETSKIMQLIQMVLLPVRDEKYCFLYKGTSGSSEFVPFDDYSTSDGSVESGELSIEEIDEEGTLKSLEPEETELVINDGDSIQSSLGAALKSDGIASAPIFVRFMLNGIPASIDDLMNIKESSSLSTHVSVFTEQGGTQHEMVAVDPSQLPLSHLNASIELSMLLNAYVAEQTLERLRHHGGAIAAADLRLARACIRKARGVVTSTIDVFFYVGPKDAMVPASAPAGAETEVDEGFKLVLDELQKQKTERLIPFGDNGFLFADTEPGCDALEYWCFVNVRKMRGDIVVEVHHRDGTEMASVVMAAVHDLISMCCHRVNQILLLRHLHMSRTASSLLIPLESENRDDRRDSSLFYPGLFDCPVVFRTAFDLFHRCATNPTHVARTLEATVLQIFGVSNRRHFFVYKDETGSIFYMTLLATGGGVEADGTIELLVHGVYEPGPSVTRQLKKLLQKRLLIIAIDMLSSVLTKNPLYNWRDADFAFVRNFREEWLSLLEDKGKPAESEESERYYAFPAAVYDPVMVLLYFRQNLGASTFFHRLQGTENERVPKNNLSSHDRDPVHGASNLVVNWSSFAFYYNNAPSKLDPKTQGTLTSKGLKFSRSAGSGIAILEPSLVDDDGREVTELSVALPPDQKDSCIEFPMESLRMIRVDSPRGRSSETSSSRYTLRVKITGTTLKRAVLHEWILLTFNQGVVASTIERHLEREQRGLLHVSEMRNSTKSFSSELARKEALDRISPGLPAFQSALQSAHALPHPAVLKFQQDGNVRSSAVATVALDLLENTLLDQLRTETKGKVGLNLSSDLFVIRFSRSECPRRVQLSWDSHHHRAVVRGASDDGDGSEVIRDAPIDCPEYICFYRVPEYSRKVEDDTLSPPRLFEEVAIDDGTSDPNGLLPFLEQLKQQYPRSFYRSFAFIFSIKRNRRTLLTYNWSPQLFKSTVSRLVEKDTLFLSSTSRSVDLLQRRSLKVLSPKLKVLSPKPDAIVEKPKSASVLPGAPPRLLRNETSSLAESSDSASVSEADRSEKGPLRPAPVRRIARPVTMRRPKLIGKSVEGAAMHAVAASRARAKSNAFKGNSTGGSVGAPPKGQSAEAKTTQTRNVPVRRAGDTIKPTRVLAVQEDSDVNRGVRTEFDFILNKGSETLLRRHSLQADAARSLTRLWWPLKPKYSISLAVADFLMSQSSPAWSDASELVQLPAAILSSFPISFGQALSAWTPGLRLLSLEPKSLTSNGNNPVILMGDVRNVRNCKCFGVIRLSTIVTRISGESKTLVVCNGWVLTLPRRTKRSGEAVQAPPIYNCRSTFEKDSTGLDKLAADLRSTLPLESMMFDYVAWAVERAMKSVDGNFDYTESLQLVRQLINKNQIGRQIKMLKSNYKAFEATINLKSYRNRLIDKYDAPSLFGWLMSNTKNQGLIPCGADGMCFKREVIVRGTHSICFLTCEKAVPESMILVILCRTQGRNLHEFMFREGSNTAISIVDNIAVEVAGLAFEELHSAASSLHRDAVWKTVSHFDPAANTLAGSMQEDVDELLELTSVSPIWQFLKNKTDIERLAMVLDDELGINWGQSFDTMAKDPLFSPAWVLSNDNDQRSRRLFYVSAEDVLVLVIVSPSGSTPEIYLVEREENSLVGPRSAFVIQKLTNFLLHCLWSGLY